MRRGFKSSVFRSRWGFEVKYYFSPHIFSCITLLRGFLLELSLMLTPPPSLPWQSSADRSGSGCWRFGSRDRGRSIRSPPPRTDTPGESWQKQETCLITFNATHREKRKEVDSDIFNYSCKKLPRYLQYSLQIRAQLFDLKLRINYIYLQIHNGRHT